MSANVDDSDGSVRGKWRKIEKSEKKIRFSKNSCKPRFISKRKNVLKSFYNPLTKPQLSL